MGKAIFIECPNLRNEGSYLHSMRDGCYGCAPYWEFFPACPIHQTKLRELTTEPRYDEKGNRIGTLKGYCRACKKHYDTSDRP